MHLVLVGALAPAGRLADLASMPKSGADGAKGSRPARIFRLARDGTKMTSSGFKAPASGS
ncbi:MULTISPECIES: hypothetical protein [unclassified Devosia]|uniref:hypothetical protein n=1 Tax=unclassified Devosia TaxID=196773 RepID=UPI001ACD5132|nr:MULTISPECIES: hypothetical protein [unclassified Devosia]MBN9305965.1 hypothetical protein [Devosia sp.]